MSDATEFVTIEEAMFSEEARLLDIMSNMDPKSKEYVDILGRWKSLATIRTQNNKINESFDSDIEKIKFEKEKLQFNKEQFEKDLETKKKELEQSYELKSKELDAKKEEIEKNFEFKNNELDQRREEMLDQNEKWTEENKNKKKELELEEKELEQTKKDLLIKNIISATGVVVTVILGFANLATFLLGQKRDIKFSETGTYLNAYGKHSSSNAQKLLKFNQK